MGLAIVLDDGRLITMFPTSSDLPRILSAVAITLWISFGIAAARDRIEAKLDRNHTENQRIIGRLDEVYRRMDHIHARLGDLSGYIPAAVAEYGDERETHGHLTGLAQVVGEQSVDQTQGFQRPYLVPNEN
jgi:hypothetical protein